jgi:hypothetical protein
MMMLLMLLSAQTIPSRDSAPISVERPGEPAPPSEQPGDRVTSPLGQALDLLDRDAVQAQNPGLSQSERTQLALEIRAEGDRVRALVSNRPTAQVKLGFDLEKQTVRLFDALTRNDRDAVGREAGALGTQIHALRAAMTP